MEVLSEHAKLTRRDIYSVSRLNREVKLLLETGFSVLWIEGEISNLAQPGSGHLYFCLKDNQAQIRCALFRTAARNLACRPRDGMLVLVRARVSLYEGRGEFQLIVEHVEDAGEGALRRAFDALKARLGAEGLFDLEQKKPLPALPRRIGIITSPTGAAIRDILTTLKRRFPSIPVLVYPVPVQGQGAAVNIADAIGLASTRKECDVLIVARGGGSLEDLWAFNEEPVARALFACRIPVVTGIGHETDFTIADLVADVRAPTPTAAAELITPEQSEWLTHFERQEGRLAKLMRRKLIDAQQHLDWLSTRLVSPDRRIVLTHARLCAAVRRLYLAQQHDLSAVRHRYTTAELKLRRLAPLARVREARLRAQHGQHRLFASVRTTLRIREQRLKQAAFQLNTVSPLATLERGYAIVTHGDTPLRDARRVRPGDTVNARLARGTLGCVVKEVNEK
jgi:exodeoxyribonuclease VII large subunit